MSEHEWYLVLTLIGLLLAAIGYLVNRNYTAINRRIGYIVDDIKKTAEQIDKQNDRIDEVEKFGSQLAACQVECTRNYVSKEDWVRSEAFTRNKLDGVSETLSRMEGKLDVVGRMPEIAAAVAREIVGGKPK